MLHDTPLKKIPTIPVKDRVSAQLIRRRNLIEFLDPKGFFTFEHWRKGVLLSKQFVSNVVTVEGKNFMLNNIFQGVATSEFSVWYMGLIDALTGWTEVDEDDTYDNINQAGNLWDEFVNYDIGASSVNRGTWDVSAASAKQVTSSTQTQFDITGAGGTIKGAFICGGAIGEAKLKDDHTAGTPANILFSASVLSGGDVAVVISDTFKVTYTITT